MSRSIKVEDGHAVIRIPLDEVHGLRVAMQGCPCRATKSNSTRDIRESIGKALARIDGLK